MIAGELTFASDFYCSPLPVASLGALYAGLHFVLSMLIFSSLCLLVLLLIFLILLAGDLDLMGGHSDERPAHYSVDRDVGDGCQRALKLDKDKHRRPLHQVPQPLGSEDLVMLARTLQSSQAVEG